MKFGNKKDVILLITVACLALLLALPALFAGAGRSALVYVDGKEVLRVALQDGMAEQTIPLGTSPALSVHIAEGKISFCDAACPDQICVKSGALFRAGQTAACLPAKAVLVIQGKGSAPFDAITY